MVRWFTLIARYPACVSLENRNAGSVRVELRTSGQFRLLGDSKIESTVRHLGIEVDDAIEIAEKIDRRDAPISGHVVDGQAVADLRSVEVRFCIAVTEASPGQGIAAASIVTGVLEIPLTTSR